MKETTIQTCTSRAALFALLDLARERGDVTTAAAAQARLKALGVAVKYHVKKEQAKGTSDER